MSKSNRVGLLQAPGMLLGDAVNITSSIASTLVTATSKVDGIVENVGEAAVLHSAIIRDDAEAARLIAQYEHKARIAEINAKHEVKPKTGAKK